MKFFGASPITAINRWPITRSTHTWNRWNGVFTMHSFSRLPSVRPWVSSLQPHTTEKWKLSIGNSAFDRLRKYCAVKHYWTIVYDILCVDRDPGEWISFRLPWRFLWQSGKTSALRRFGVVWAWVIWWRFFVAVFGRPRAVQSVQNGHDEELCTATPRSDRPNHSLLAARHCDIPIPAIADLFVFRELVVHGVAVLFICDVDDDGIWRLCANLRPISGE